MNLDYDQIVRIVTEEVVRYLQEAAGGAPPQAVTSSSCGCPLPAVSGLSVQDPMVAARQEPAASACPATAPATVQNPASMSAGGAAPLQPQANPRKRILCLFSGANEGFETFLAAAEAWIPQGVAIDGIYSDSAKYILPMQKLERLGIREITDPAPFGHHFQDLKNYDLILLPTLTRTVVAKLALGITDNLLLNLTYTSLAYNLKIMASTDGLAPSACPVCANHLPGIPELLDEYQARLRRLGIQLFPMGRLVSMAAHQVLGVGPAAAGPQMEVITTLITQHDAQQLPGPVVRVKRGGLVTPSARDVLSQRGISVEVVSE